MQRTILLAIVLVGLGAYPNWAQEPEANPAVSPPAPPVAERTESPTPAAVDSKADIKPLEEKLLEQELLKFVGRWKLISASEKNIKIADSDGMEFRRHGDDLEATVSQRGVNKSFTVTLTVSDTPERIRRIKLAEKQFNDEPQTVMAVYEISGVDGENDKPLRLKMNLSKNGNYPASMDARGKGIHQLELEFEQVVPREGALGLPASAIPGKVWVSSGTVIVAIADDGKSASAYCEQHPTWVAVQLDSTIEAKPVPIVGAKVATVQHGNQCHAYSPRHQAWATLTLPAREEAIPSVGGFASTATVQSKSQGEYVFKDEWGKWFSAEEIKAGKVAEHLAALKAKGGQTNSPEASVTKIFSLQHSQATDVVDVLIQLYGLNAIKVTQDARKNTVIVSGPSDQLREIEALIQWLDETGPTASLATFSPLTNEAAKLIFQLEDERVKLLQNLGDKHPKIEELDARLAQARSQITLNPEPPKADSKESLQKEMEQALGYLEMVTESTSPIYIEAKDKMTTILASYDQTPAQAKIKGLKLIAQVEAEALPLLEADLEKLKSRRSVQSPESLKKYEMFLAYGTVTVAKLRQRVIAQLRKDYDAAEAEAQRLAEQLRQPGSTASKDELRKTVERAFTLRQSLLRAELSDMLDRLAKTQHSIDLRDRITDQIVTCRVEELLNPQLEWDESKSGRQPVAPSASSKESTPTQPQEWTTKLQGHWQLMQHTYEPVDTSDGKKQQPGDIKRENWNPETYYRKQTTPWKAMFDGHQMSICKEDGSDPMTFELTFRKAGPPQQVDLTMELSQADLAELNQMDEEDRSSYVIPTFKGILEETPDGFRMCLDMGRTQTRPFLFVLGPDTGLWEFRREAATKPEQPHEQAAD
jgi:hypothetical protein